MRSGCFLGVVFSLLLPCTLVAESAATRPDSRKWEVTIRDPYLRDIGEDTVWAAAKSVGITRLECVLDENLACPYLLEKGAAPYRIDTEENRKILARKLESEGMSIGCFAMVVRLATPVDEQRAAEWIVRAAKAAPGVGCRHIMLPVAIVDEKGEKVSDERFVTVGRRFVRALDRIAAETGVQLMLENLGHYWNRPEILLPVLRESEPDRVGLLHDVCNMYWFGHPLDKLYSLTQEVAPFVRCVHVKSVKYPTDRRNQQRSPGWEYIKYAEPVPTGDIDFGRILAIYARAGYVGDLCIEDDSLGKFDAAGKKKAIADDVAFLQELIARLPK
ncbi:MAG TPA: TIM barrel protein [Phycisphaerae bacterium]|nr:TIM barrel protein [Phycisphaerae bacterium]HOJ72690.1 TIM barrel protein [Phycisphaerae bacterium]HOM49649.1 TIM barrel protein [Phycisphaerae bacterium]HON65086.1 TIM barrel protein [Phycisphaerae bacterium]HPP25018.1 TIM barrel protein [Phycisphaerae bacterium]